MNIHEYQGKQVLKKFGVPVPRGVIAFSVAGAEKAAIELGTPVLVVKAQIHAGGRGQGVFKEGAAGSGGGVKVVKSVQAVQDETERMLGKTLVTHQTGPEGKLVRKVYIEEGSQIKKEYYLSLVIDRQTSRVTFIASTEGGMDIEEVAKKDPSKIVTVSIDPATGLCSFHERKIAFGLGLRGEQIKKMSHFVRCIYNAFVSTDASQVEINPLVETESGDFIALDAKLNFDSNALYRHPEIMELRDDHEEDPAELEASQFDLNYIKMQGNIGCMVNGAGLAMATMDIIKLYGGDPANFLDVGGGATKERVKEAFKIILSDKNVKGILINIFGGIMRCDIIAEGVVWAAKDIGINIPVVVRLEGTNAEQGKQILASSGLKIQSADGFADAAKRIVNAVK